MPIIGITGFKQSGKSTIAKILTAHGFAYRPFAAPLKNMLRVIGLNTEQLYGDQKEVPSPLLCGKTPRYAMQTLGTDWARDMIGGDIWINAWRTSIAGEGHVLADDVRFANEADAILSAGGVLWRVRRDGCKGDGHASEAQIMHLPVTMEFDNNGTLTELQTAVAIEVQKIMGT